MSGERLGRDLRLKIDNFGADLAVDPSGDLGTVEGIENLAQAIVCRLSTEIGEMADLGHSEYGSRLNEAIGETRSDRTLKLIQRAIASSLAGERRIREVLSISTTLDVKDPNLVSIEITVVPTTGGGPISITYPLRLEV
ncbi:MAG: DUF2634 domain-containing protein [Candidatus Verstraetearchaeota archaeon]|nr:DUF2634 domain-containing protein [Candidatus Verstraetearchaeota archaeon]